MNDGGCAFPIVTDTEVHPGISMRDYFAAMALQGLCSCVGETVFAKNAELADACYSMADAMLKERVK